MRDGAVRGSLLCLLLLLPGTAPCAAQRLPDARFEAAHWRGTDSRGTPPDSTGNVFIPTLLAGSAGSGLGIVAGFVVGAKLGWGGGDDPGLTGAVVGAGVGSAAGSAFFARAVRRGHGMTYGPDVTMGIGLLGAAAGLGGMFLAHEMGARDAGLLAGYMLAQGTTVATVMTLTWR